MIFIFVIIIILKLVIMTNIYLRMRRIRRIQNQMSREYTFIVDGIEYIDIIKSLNRSQDLNRRREKKYELCH